MTTNLMSGPFAKLAGVFDDLVTLSADQIAMTNVPDFLKIAALNAQAQTRNTPVSPPQSTVADDLLAGVGALETSPDQFGDRYYNRGGIVSFSKQMKAGVPRDVALFNIGEYGKEKPITSMDELSGLISKKIPKRAPGKKPPTTPDSAISVTPRTLMPSFEDIVGPEGEVSLRPEDYKTEYTPYIPPKPKTREQIMDARRERELAAGVDREEYMTKKRERLSKLEERFAEETKQAPWLALMQAGLKMAQTPGGFGQALAAGAQTGLTDYLRAKEDLTESEQALLDRQDALDDLGFAMKMGDVNAMQDADERAEDAKYRAAEINFNGENEVRMRNSQIDFEVARAKLAEQGRMQTLRALHEYRLADLTKDYAMIEATLGKAAMDANVNLAKAANTGKLTENQILEALVDQIEEIKNDPAFLDTYFKDKPSATEEEINAQAMRVARNRVTQLQLIVAGQRQVANYLNSSGQLGGLGSLGTTGFSLTPASK